MTAGLYPEIEPYDQGMLEVGDGNRVYWEVCGNPDGKPAVVLHGGPGSGCGAGHRRFFDPAAYRIVLLDQRGCGRSTPHASEPGVDLTANTTEHLVEDLERLRGQLGIGRWLVFGGSWGSVLGLVYAERHPDRVSELVLTGVFTGRRAETDLLVQGLRGFFPEAWARFRDGARESGGDLIAAYHRLLADPDPAVHHKAARDWCDWEEAIVPTSPGPSPRFQDAGYRLAFTRIVTHYWSHGSWLEEGVVLEETGSLAGIPGVIVQGALDVGNLLGIPWELARAWPDSELVLVSEAGHDTGDGGMSESLVAATDRFARRAAHPELSEPEYLKHIERLARAVVSSASAEDARLRHRVDVLARALRYYHFDGDGCLEEDRDRPKVRLAGVLLLRPEAMPAGMDDSYEQMCLRLGVEVRPEGWALWNTWGEQGDQVTMVVTAVATTETLLANWTRGIAAYPATPVPAQVALVRRGWVEPMTFSPRAVRHLGLSGKV